MLKNSYCQVKTDRGLSVVRLADGTVQFWLDGKQTLQDTRFSMDEDSFRLMSPVEESDHRGFVTR